MCVGFVYCFLKVKLFTKLNIGNTLHTIQRFACRVLSFIEHKNSHQPYRNHSINLTELFLLVIMKFIDFLDLPENVLKTTLETPPQPINLKLTNENVYLLSNLRTPIKSVFSFHQNWHTEMLTSFSI